MRINTTRLRCIIGWLGMLLPWIVCLLVGYIPDSISATWYTNACTVFMIILGSASLLLISYKGYDWLDDLVLTTAGICGLGICLFPTGTQLVSDTHVGTFMLPMHVSSSIHMLFAILFFVLLAYNSIFLFTKGSSEPTKNKKIRNKIYIVCGIGMLAAFLLMLLPDFYAKVWIVETIALFFFGLSFLTKAEAYKFLFKD